VRVNHAKNNAQKGCVMQWNGITLIAGIPSSLAHSPPLFLPRSSSSTPFTPVTQAINTVESRYSLTYNFCLLFLLIVHSFFNAGL